MTKKRIYKRENCNPTVRSSVFTTPFGDKVILMGRHAHEWEVVTIPMYGPTKCMIFREGRIPAKRYFKTIKDRYKIKK